MTKNDQIVWGSIKAYIIICFGWGSGLSWDGSSETPPSSLEFRKKFCLFVCKRGFFFFFFLINVRHPGWPRYPYCIAMFGFGWVRYDMISRLLESTPMQQLHSNFGKMSPKDGRQGDQETARGGWGGDGRLGFWRMFSICSHQVFNVFTWIF
jgi:hypothetical protein